MQVKQFNFSDLISDEQINSRTDYGDISNLADNIRINGLIKPLEGFESPEGTFHIRDGFRRFRALQELSSQGYEFPVPCLVKPETEFSEAMGSFFLVLVIGYWLLGTGRQTGDKMTFLS